jgi:hypothetical protein
LTGQETIKAEIEQRFSRRSGRKTVREALPEERGLAAPAHADHSQRFATDCG